MNLISSAIRKCSIGEYSIIYRKIEDQTIDQTIFAGAKDYMILSPNMRYWYADPITFIINNNTYVFMEMMDAYLKKGVIGVSRFDENGMLSKPQVIIDEPFHMSFPHVFAFEDDIYMIPETSEVNEIRLYKMGNTPYQWDLKKAIKTEEKFADTITYEKEGERFLLTCELGDNLLKTKLRLFRMMSVEELLLEEIELKNKDFRLDCRNAGNLFSLDNELYRVAQASTADEYGISVKLNHVDEIGNEAFAEHEVIERGIESVNCKTIPVIRKKKGIHTFSLVGEFEVLDIYIGKITLKKILQPLFGAVYRVLNNG